MSLNLRFQLDATGRPRAAGADKTPVPPALIQFLESDLAMDTAYCDRIVAGEKQVKPEAPWKIAGNAFSITMGKDETTLAPLVETKAVEPVTLPTREFLDLVRMWRVFLKGPPRKKT
jgi:hypothetical protein